MRRTTATIALIEAFDHQEVLFGLCKLLDVSGIHLEIIAPAQWLKDASTFFEFQSASYQWHNLPVNWSRMKRPFPNLQHCDLIIIITLGSPWQKWSEINPSTPILAIVHNIHDLFCAKKWQLAKTAFQFPDWLTWLKSQMQHREFWKKIVIANITVFGFAEKRLFHYALENSWLSAQKPGVIIPFAFFSAKNQKKYSPRTNEITIVIPGTIKNNGRDYELVQRSFWHLRGLVSGTIHLVFLGSAKKKEGKDIIKKFQPLISNYFYLHTFENALPQELYDKWLSRADFSILPFRAESRFGLTIEKMGVSTISGAENDLLRFGIPALVTTTYPLPEHFKSLTQSYTDEHQLTQLLWEWIEEDRFLDFRKSGAASLYNQQISNLRERFFTDLSLIFRRI